MSNLNLGFVIFPDLTELDLIGPLQVLARLPHSTTHIIAKSNAPVPSDCGLSLVPTHTFADALRLISSAFPAACAASSAPSAIERRSISSVGRPRERNM